MGNIWRVDLTTNPWTREQAVRLQQADPGGARADLDAMGRPMVFFGTGEFISPGDLTTTTTQTVYGLIDDSTGTQMTTRHLVDQSLDLHIRSPPARRAGPWI